MHHQFCSTIYPTLEAKRDAQVRAWLTADGRFAPHEVIAMLNGEGDDQLARQMFAEFDGVGDYYTELKAAFARLRLQAELCYATIDADGRSIAENAHIKAFYTRDDAVAWLAWCHGPDDAIEVVYGDFGDCWIKSHRAPGEENIATWCSPFAAGDLQILAPHQNPGNAWWITPIPEILVALVTPADD